MLCVKRGLSMEKVGLNITTKEFKPLCTRSKNICSTTIIIDYFIENRSEIEEYHNLAFVIKHLRNDENVLHAFKRCLNIL